MLGAGPRTRRILRLPGYTLEFPRHTAMQTMAKMNRKMAPADMAP